ncbi:MAG: protease pro-enzyme activation domain-containing protein [Candidatus Binataceae bacterium]
MKFRNISRAVIGFVFAIAAIAGSVQAAVIAGNSVTEARDFVGKGSLAADSQLQIRITMALHNSDQLDTLLAAQQDSSSSQYHQWLTPDQFNDRFGPTADDLAQVEGWLTQSGFSVQSASMSQRTVVATAPVSVVEATFAVKIGATADGSTYANLSDPAVPAAIAPLISSIDGLANTARFQPAYTGDAQPVANPDALINGKLAFGPQDTWAFYDETALNNAGIIGSGIDCIALVETSDFDVASAQLFNTTFGLPLTNVIKVFPDGSSPGENGALDEAMLDVEYSHAAAPGANIVAYIGKGDNALDDAITAAVQSNQCGIVSISFGTCGEPQSFFTGPVFATFWQAAAQGQAVYISSGDSGAAGNMFSPGANGCVVGTSRHINELSARPQVTSVGGTQFTPVYNSQNIATGYTSEAVWHNRPENHAAKGAGGGGVSAIYSKPAYQRGVFPKSRNRNVPDIAFAASNRAPGFFLATDGEIKCCTGGTSLSAPYWAGITALAEQEAGGARIGNINLKIYSLGPLGDTAQSGLHDVTQGNNNWNGVKGFKAIPGYDRATGWGTPDIGIIVPLLAQ